MKTPHGSLPGKNVPGSGCGAFNWRRNMKNKKLKKAIQYEIFLLPAFIAFTLFTIIPLVKTIMYSVTDFMESAMSIILWD